MRRIKTEKESCTGKLTVDEVDNSHNSIRGRIVFLNLRIIGLENNVLQRINRERIHDERMQF